MYKETGSGVVHFFFFCMAMWLFVRGLGIFLALCPIWCKIVVFVQLCLSISTHRWGKEIRFLCFSQYYPRFYCILTWESLFVYSSPSSNHCSDIVYYFDIFKPTRFVAMGQELDHYSSQDRVHEAELAKEVTSIHHASHRFVIKHN